MNEVQTIDACVDFQCGLHSGHHLDFALANGTDRSGYSNQPGYGPGGVRSPIA